MSATPSLFIIARPLGSRHYQFWNSAYFPVWRESPEDAYGFQSRDGAETYLNKVEHKESEGGWFKVDDFVRPFYSFDLSRCQFCNSIQMRQIGIAVAHPSVQLFMRCDGCWKEIMADYRFINKEDIPKV